MIQRIARDENAAYAANLLSRYNLGSLPVCTSEGNLKGIVTDRDIVLRCVAEDTPADQTRIKEIMSRAVVTISPDDELTKATELMSEGQIRRLPVVNEGKLVGILSLADLARSPRFSMEASKTLSDISINVLKPK